MRAFAGVMKDWKETQFKIEKIGSMLELMENECKLLGISDKPMTADLGQPDIDSLSQRERAMRYLIKAIDSAKGDFEKIVSKTNKHLQNEIIHGSRTVWTRSFGKSRSGTA